MNGLVCVSPVFSGTSMVQRQAEPARHKKLAKLFLLPALQNTQTHQQSQVRIFPCFMLKHRGDKNDFHTRCHVSLWEGLRHGAGSIRLRGVHSEAAFRDATEWWWSQLNYADLSVGACKDRLKLTPPPPNDTRSTCLHTMFGSRPCGACQTCTLHCYRNITFVV